MLRRILLASLVGLTSIGSAPVRGQDIWNDVLTPMSPVVQQRHAMEQQTAEIRKLRETQEQSNVGPYIMFGILGAGAMIAGAIHSGKTAGPVAVPAVSPEIVPSPVRKEIDPES